MIDDLLGRINSYQERIKEYFRRQAAAAVEFEDEDEDYEFEDTHLSDSWTIPDEIFFDDHVEVINGHRYYSREANGDAPSRYTVSEDNPWYFDIDGVVFSRETGLLILFPPGKAEEYTIPDDERITGIDSCAFAANKNLKRIIWNARIRYIGLGAFMRCTSIQEIVLPAGVEYIGDQAFEGCESLKRAVLDCGIRNIPARTFYHDKALESVLYPAGITEIGRSVFSGCASLKSIRPCADDHKEWDVVLPQGIRQIAPELFAECSLIRSVCVPDNVETIGREAFRNCAALQTIRTDHVKEFGAYCFQNCRRLEKAVFGTGTSFLGKEIFTGATDLKSICFSCSPDFHCAADALPEHMDYSVDTQAYLATAKPYFCRPLFFECVRNLAKGDMVSGETVGVVLQILKRNRRRLEDWFLENPEILSFVLNTDILDCDSCVSLLKKSEAADPETAEKIQTCMASRFTAGKIAAALKKWERETIAAKEVEAGDRKSQTEREMKKDKPVERLNPGDFMSMSEEEPGKIPLLWDRELDEILEELKNIPDE